MYYESSLTLWHVKTNALRSWFFRAILSDHPHQANSRPFAKGFGKFGEMLNRGTVFVKQP